MPPMFPPSVASPVGGLWRRRLTGAGAAMIILVGFYILILGSLKNKSATMDETGHIAAGYSYWLFNDYRLDPENGNLPQRFVALPLIFNRTHFPSFTSDAWHASNQFDLSYEWFYRMGNDADSMLARSRAAAALLAVALGALVWLWARQLFGPLGGMLSLILYVFNPTILANGGLTTSDTACSLFFLAATWSIWGVLHRVSVGRVLGSALVLGGLFVSKMSAPLMILITLVMVIGRLLWKEPLPVRLGGQVWQLNRRGAQALALFLAAVVHAIVVIVVIWASYGFRYNAFARFDPARDHLACSWDEVLGKPPLMDMLVRLGLSQKQRSEVTEIFSAQHAMPASWTDASVRAVTEIELKVLTLAQVRQMEKEMAAPLSVTGRTLETIRRFKLLPEAYIFGLAAVIRFSDHRPAFLNGEYSVYGWKRFFPYTFLVKTPLSVLAIMFLALVAAGAKWREMALSGSAGREALLGGWYRTLPLWTLQVYWVVPILSHMNIGHRHIMPVYAPSLILCGAAAYWFRCMPELRASKLCRVRVLGFAVCLLVLALAGEIMYRFPNYLAYFNGVVSPKNAWRHVVDSSLDWGQDLPGVMRYIEKNRPDRPIYLSYFGGGSPAYCSMPVRLLPGNLGNDTPSPMLVVDLPPGDVEMALADKLRQAPLYDCIATADDDKGNAMAIFLEKPGAFYWAGGTYFISATMLQTVGNGIIGATPFGMWNNRYEANYQALAAKIKPLFSPDPNIGSEAFKKYSIREWQYMLECFDAYRLGRLTAYLRQREPDDNVNFSILVYKLTDTDLARALDGPPPELGADVLTETGTPERSD